MKRLILLLALTAMQLPLTACGERVLWRAEIHAGVGSAEPPPPVNVQLLTVDASTSTQH